MRTRVQVKGELFFAEWCKELKFFAPLSGRQQHWRRDWRARPAKTDLQSTLVTVDAELTAPSSRKPCELAHSPPACSHTHRMNGVNRQNCNKVCQICAQRPIMSAPVHEDRIHSRVLVQRRKRRNRYTKQMQYKQAGCQPAGVSQCLPMMGASSAPNTETPMSRQDAAKHTTTARCARTPQRSPKPVRTPEDRDAPPI